MLSHPSPPEQGERHPSPHHPCRRGCSSTSARPSCLVQTSLQPAEHSASNSSAITEERKSLQGHLQTLRRVKQFRERGWRSRQRSEANAMSARHGRAGALRTGVSRPSCCSGRRDAARTPQRWARLRSWGTQAGRIVEELEGPALLQASSETS